MSGVSVSKAVLTEQRKRDGLQEQAIKHHTEAIESLTGGLNKMIDHQEQLEAWAEKFSGMPFKERWRWMLFGK